MKKNLSYEAVMETIEIALAAAYRKDFGNKQQNIKVKFDPETGDMKAWDVKEVVNDIDEEVLKNAQEEAVKRREKARKKIGKSPKRNWLICLALIQKTEIMMTKAQEFKKKAKLGEILEMPLEITGEFGRMALKPPSR